jgi:hypothetical protein
MRCKARRGCGWRSEGRSSIKETAATAVARSPPIEPIALTGNGHHEIVIIGALAERQAERGNLARQIVLVDDGVRPDAGQEVIFGEDVAALFEERDEHVKGL